MQRWLSFAATTCLACGPVVSEATTGENASGSGGVSSGSGGSTGGDDTTTDPSAEASGASTGDPFGTTGDPSGDCPPPLMGLTQLWCGEVDPAGPLVVDDDWIYFVTLSEDIARVPIAGGDAELLVGGAGDVATLVRHQSTLYWTSFFGGTVGRVALPDGAPELLADDLFKPDAVAVVGTEAFVTQYGDPYPLVRIDLDSGARDELYPDLDYAANLFALGDRLYFNTSANNGNVPTPLLVGDVNGTPVQTVVTGSWVINDLDPADVDPERPTLWWARYEVEGSVIMRTLLEPGTDDTTEVFATPNQPVAIATTEARVYWTEWNAGTNRVRSIDRDGGTEQLHHQDDDAGEVVTTPLGVVFPTRGVLLRID